MCRFIFAEEARTFVTENVSRHSFPFFLSLFFFLAMSLALNSSDRDTDDVTAWQNCFVVEMSATRLPTIMNKYSARVSEGGRSVYVRRWNFEKSLRSKTVKWQRDRTSWRDFICLPPFQSRASGSKDDAGERAR